MSVVDGAVLLDFVVDTVVDGLFPVRNGRHFAAGTGATAAVTGRGRGAVHSGRRFSALLTFQVALTTGRFCIEISGKSKSMLNAKKIINDR